MQPCRQDPHRISILHTYRTPKGSTHAGKVQEKLLEWVSGYPLDMQKNKAMPVCRLTKGIGQREQKDETPQQVFNEEYHPYAKCAEENRKKK